jgi:hypothetical protein
MKDREFKYGYDGNPYYNPEACGLVQMDTIEDEPDYDFNMVVVWQDTASKKYYFGADSGCSCPSPFEDVRRLSDLTLLNKKNFNLLKEAVENGLWRVSAIQKGTFLSKWKSLI